MPNYSKYISYKAAWDRIKDCNHHGYYIESISICESIISDRLLSLSLSIPQKESLSERTSLHELIKHCKVISKKLDTLNSLGGVQILEEANNWRKLRNETIHGLAKSLPGKPTKDPRVFFAAAKYSAEEGTKLARAICRWHKKLKLISPKVDQNE